MTEKINKNPQREIKYQQKVNDVISADWSDMTLIEGCRKFKIDHYTMVKILKDHNITPIKKSARTLEIWRKKDWNKSYFELAKENNITKQRVQQIAAKLGIRRYNMKEKQKESQ